MCMEEILVDNKKFLDTQIGRGPPKLESVSILKLLLKNNGILYSKHNLFSQKVKILSQWRPWGLHIKFVLIADIKITTCYSQEVKL